MTTYNIPMLWGVAFDGHVWKAGQNEKPEKAGTYIWCVGHTEEEARENFRQRVEINEQNRKAMI